MKRVPRQAWQWVALGLLSFVLVAGLEWLRLPAALLLGALVAAVLFAVANAGLRVPSRLFLGAQAVVGGMIAQAFPPAIFAEMARDWPVFLGGVVSVLIASTLLGWLLTRRKILPGSTAIWGSSPGAATAMTLMSESYDADSRLVAFMQYLRVVLVAVVATIMARFWITATLDAVPAIVWFPPIPWPSFGMTLVVVTASAVIGRALRIPAGALLAPIAIGTALQDAGLITIILPPWLLALAYLLVGWNIGFRFNRPILVHAAKTLPSILMSILCLITVCGAMAAVLVQIAHVDPLTAYLATSPGGADSVAIIAASSPVDVPFVMAMQTARFVVVVLTGPAIARFMTARSMPAASRTARAS